MYFLQTIFAPDQNQLNRNINSIKSLDLYLKKYPYNVVLKLGGWCANDDYWNQFYNALKETSLNYEIVKFDNNMGKSYTINTIFNKFKNEIVSKGYFLTADSDICFDTSCEYIFQRLNESPEMIQKELRKPFGMMALNQKEQCCHVFSSLTKEFQYKNSFNFIENFKYSDKSAGIAGGCIFTSTNCWEKIGGYRLINVYGGDDGYYALDTYLNGFSCLISIDMSIIHPYDTDRNYIHWKRDEVQKIHLTGGHNRKVNDYLQTLENAKNFWKNK